MIAGFSLHNLWVWMAQVFVVASIGLFLPALFRIRHPWSKLIYCRLLLAIVLVLPLIQPLKHEIVVTVPPDLAAAGASTDVTPTSVLPEPVSFKWSSIVMSILLAGCVGGAVWLAGGLWQLRRMRNSSRALSPWPDSIASACEASKTQAQFCISESIQGPVTFGFRRPVVLLPQSFLEMSSEAQLNVACHELLHVRRNDWLMTVLEEFAASFLWFQPTVWLLVSEIRLSREQLVDAQVISLTDSRESYIDALCSLANAKWEADLSVASLFSRKRQLLQRMHFLLSEVSLSKFRLLSSYASIAAMLALTGWLMFLAL